MSDTDDLVGVRLRDIPRNRSIPTRWGRWRRDRTNNTLEFWDDLRGKVYWIDLNTMTTAASCLNWIFQGAPLGHDSIGTESGGKF